MDNRQLQNNKRNRREPWRIVVGIISILFIAYMWVQKDIMAIYTTMPQEEVLPLIVTTLAVSLLKVTAITGGILLAKWVVNRLQKKDLKDTNKDMDTGE